MRRWSAAATDGVVILDLVMPGMDGLEVIKRMRERDIELPVIVQTAKGSIDTAVSAMRAGAFDFVVKPASPERLQVAVSNALKVDSLGGEAKRARKSAAGTLTFNDIVTGSPAMQRVISLARKAAGSNIPILIEGESGSGKEVIARAIQAESDRRSKALVTVNCGAIPDNLVESILFGHEKGSFTGATEKHVGKFVEANGGTLFLDEIGDLPLDVQVKLLRAVQEGEADPVGARQTVKVNIRLIPQRTAISCSASRKVSSARTCSTASMSSRSTCRRCANGARTSRRWCSTSFRALAPLRRAGASPASLRGRSPCSRPMTGRATSASLKTPSSARSLAEGELLTETNFRRSGAGRRYRRSAYETAPPPRRKSVLIPLRYVLQLSHTHNRSGTAAFVR